jgi:L-seryl-tRNA(Ser) seleniumtransferase
LSTEADERSTELTPEQREQLRALPAVAALLARPAVAALAAEKGQPAVVRAVRSVLARERGRITGIARAAGEERGDAALRDERALSDEAIASAVREGEQGSLRPVLNATGVLLHTNLGRAPLAREALEAAVRVGEGFCSLEYDLEEGARGDRHGHVTALLCELTGAEDAAVVNNNAAAMLLTLSALAAGREVIISRGELVEIGGGFRIPDVLRQSGAALVEVGTTNRTRLSDYRDALSPGTAMLLKVHPSSFAVVGFTSAVSVAELSPLARERGVPLVHDAGSGSFFHDEPGEPHVRGHIEAGADLVLFSGDKLLGGPQAGLIVGRAALVERVRRHPLMRAVRPDKLCLAALEATLRLWRDAPGRIPLVAMRAQPAASLEARAARVAAALAYWFPGLSVAVATSSGKLGGGSSPLRDLAGAAVRLAVADPDAICRALRRAPQPVVARVEEGAVLLDLRAVPAEHDRQLETSARWALSWSGAGAGADAGKTSDGEGPEGRRGG